MISFNNIDKEQKILTKESNRTKKKRLKTIRSSIVSILPFLLSHHPECKKFKGHTLRIGKLNFCIGCFIGYPTAIISINVINLFNIRNFLSLQYFLIIGITLLLTFLLSFTGITKIKLIKVLQKIFIGIGASFLYWGIWYQSTPVLERYITFSIVFGLIITLLNLYHVYGFWSTCYKCETPFGWDECDGFFKIRENLRKNQLNNFFLNFKEYSEKLKNKRETKIINRNN
ncbi:MAG: hypothetical protein ACFFKA_16170 [Candidatus Thorarchaeota archaeon]